MPETAFADLFRLALALNAAAYRATVVCQHGESDRRVLDIRNLSVAIAPAVQRLKNPLPPGDTAAVVSQLADLAGLRAALADLTDLAEEAEVLRLMEPVATAELRAKAGELSRALSRWRGALSASSGAAGAGA